MNCQNCEFSSHFVGNLSQKEFSVIEQNRCEFRYSKGQSIFVQNTYPKEIIYIKKGLVKIHSFHKGRNNILNFAKSGGYLGIFALASDDRYSLSATAIEETEVCFINIDDFKSVMLTNGQFALHICQLLAQSGNITINKFIDYQHKSAEAKIADIFIYFSNLYASQEYHLPLSRLEIADFAGISISMVIRILKNMTARKLLKFEKDKVQILDFDTLNIISREE